MLRITQQESAKDAKRYYSSADYLSEGQEIVGSWGGEGARLLGLEGVVDKLAFDSLCDNLDPRNGKPLTVRTRSDRRVGYDFTFSVPKSVSMLYALSGDQQILEAFRSAVDETMRDIESEMKTRVRRFNKDLDRTTGNMVWAEFIHTTSRPVDGVPDPQLHAHCFALNSTWDEQEGRWKAGQFGQLKADAPYFQAAFRVRLANKLQDLGFGVERKRDDFELTGVSAAAIRRFSRRTEEIEKVAAERGITDPKRKAELGAETRENKNKELPWHELQKEWDSRLTDAERQALAAVHRREKHHERSVGGEKQAVDYALEHCFTREAVVPERKLLTEAMKRGVAGVTVEGVQRELARRSLIRGEKDGRKIVTTDAVLTEERRVIDFARKGRGRFRPLGKADRQFTRDWLNDGQKSAVRHVLGSRDRVTIIRGAAGTGKTKLMQEAVEAIEQAGKSVVVLAPSVNASHDVLRTEGFSKADTLARFLKDPDMQEQARGNVIWVDEAGLLGTQDMARLFDTAGQLNARVILSGDRKQHHAVARGEPLKLLETKAGLPVKEVTEIMRQEPADYRKAVEQLSAGRTVEGFAELDKLGWIKQVADSDRYKEMAAAYLAAVKEKKSNGDPATAIVVSPTHAEGARITGTIRASLKADKKLGEDHTLPAWLPANLTGAQKADAVNYEAGDLLEFSQNVPGHKKGSRLVLTEGDKLPLEYADRFEVYRPAQLSLAVGDRIRVTANGWSKDRKHRLSNGALLSVQGFTRQGDLIVDHGWVVSKEFGHLAHGYVVTSHASQGKSVDKVFIGQSSQSFPATNRRQFYVSVSRGKKQAIVFTDDKEQLQKAVERADEPMSATELAESRRRRPAFRQRLRKHAAYLRRLATFAQTHAPRLPDPSRTPPLDREHAYV
ncbi:MAG TPA: MobF family relaxase [Gemmataceae bacterium]|nr:MobF family relaxase [Gemmataceae bacterium]